MNDSDVALIQNVYWNQTAAVKVNDKISMRVPINRGVRQGCVLCVPEDVGWCSDRHSFPSTITLNYSLSLIVEGKVESKRGPERENVPG